MTIEKLGNLDLKDVSAVIKLQEETLEYLSAEMLKAKGDNVQLDVLDAEYRATSDTIDFLQNQLNTTPRLKPFQEWKEKRYESERAAFNQKSEKEATDGLAEVREKIEKQLIEDILSEGGAVAHMSLPKEYSQSGHDGFYDIVDKKRIDTNGQMTPLSRIFNKYRAKEEEFKNKNVHEAATLEPLEITTYSEVEVPIEESKFFGLSKKTVIKKESRPQQSRVKMDAIVAGGKAEQAYLLTYCTFDTHHYVDYSGRLGQRLGVGLALPERLARSLVVEINRDPLVLRRVVKAVMTKKFGIDEVAWEKGNAATNDTPLKPPYEKWKDDNNGEETIYFETPEGSSNLKLQIT
jgi:hypothetical protein